MASTISNSSAFLPISFKINAALDNVEFLEDLINQAPIFETESLTLSQELSESVTF